MLGTLYSNWGQYEKAERYLTDALETIQSAYLTRHAEASWGELTVIVSDCWSTLLSAFTLTVFTVMSLMGRCYCKQRKLTESEVYHRRALKLSTELFSDRHHHTATG